jgi:pimeloyl-ACP methyl ester carboxylesterase
MIRSLVVAAALVAAASSTVVPSSAASAGARVGAVRGATLTPNTLVWQPCDVRFRCATLPVPIDYAHPVAGTLPLAVIELPAAGAHPLGDLMINPGGPGESGITWLEQDAIGFPATVRESFNLVSFDPRGVGLSDPVACGTAAELKTWITQYPAPSTPSQIAYATSEAKAFVAACEAGTKPELLDNVGTAETVNDIEQLRIALGDEKLNFFGFSYGTYLGERYAQRYPTHIRSMVLDGVVDPANGIEKSNEQQAAALEQNLTGFFSWCAANHACAAGLPGGPKAAYETLLARVEKGPPIPGIGPGNAGLPPVGLSVFELGVIASLYATTSWPFLGTALAKALQGNGSDLSVLAIGYEGIGGPGGVSNIIAAITAISCEDSGALATNNDYPLFAKQLGAISPDFGAANAWSSFICRFWPVRPSEHPQPVHAAGSPPILVVGSTEDPATPYPWARAVAGELDHGVLLTRTGYGHTAYFFSSCIMTAVDRYLVQLAVPRTGTVCGSGS